MSGDEKQYRSSLHRNSPSPTRGIGSGYAQNQALAGAQNPEAAAHMASRPESEVISTQDQLEAESKELDNLIEDVMLAVREGVWEIPDAPTDLDTQNVPALIRYLSAKAPETIKVWHDEVQAAYDKRIENEDEAILREQLQRESFVDPADPLYDPMMDRERRKRIEEGLPPLDFEEMVFKGFTRQTVPIREGFNVTFRTIPTQHGLWLEAMMARTAESSVQHTRHLFSLMQLACGLDSINGKAIGEDISKFTKEDQASREGFEAALTGRMEFIGKLPSMLTDDLIIQFVWFNGRVRRLLAGDLMRKVGNS